MITRIKSLHYEIINSILHNHQTCSLMQILIVLVAVTAAAAATTTAVVPVATATAIRI